MFGFGWLRKKREQTEEFVKQTVTLQQEHLKVTEKAAEDSAELSKKYLQIAEENTAIGRSLDSKSDQLVTLVAHNEKTKESLSQRDAILRQNEDDVEERKKEVRKQEIQIAARTAAVRTRESEAERRDQGMDEERNDIQKREKAAQKLAADSRAAKENFDAKQRKLDERKSHLESREKDLQTRLAEFDAREKEAHGIFEKAKVVDAELTEKQRTFDEKCAGIQQSLQEKIDDYDRKLADIKAAGDTVASAKFDDSEDGRQAKIVVQEAIRQAKKNLEDGARIFDELQEKYGRGTFRGFAVPLDEIDREFKKLQKYVVGIREHAASCDMEHEMRLVTESAEDHLQKADTDIKSWELAGAYRHICYGVATCLNYQKLVEIISEMQTDNSEGSDERFGEEPNYYEILGVSENATEKEIRRAYKKKAQEWHPDKAPEDRKEEFTEKMAQINQARDVLLDPDKRSKYNRKRKSS